MIDSLHNRYRMAMEFLTRTSPASVVLDFLGRTLVGKPEDLKQAPDFWEDTEDRQLPSDSEYRIPKIQAGQVAGDHFRRSLQRDLSLMGPIVAMGLCAAIFVASQIAIAVVGPDEGSGAAMSVAGYSSGAVARSNDCEALRTQIRQINDRYGNSVTDLSQLSAGEQQIVSNFTTNCRGK